MTEKTMWKGSWNNLTSSALIFFIATLHLPIIFTEAAGVIGVNYGLLGDNLPPPIQTISLLKSRNINRVRLFNPNQDVLTALQNTGIEVVLGTLNQDLPQLAQDQNFALTWLQANVLPFAATIRFRYISAGNEVIPSDLQALVLPAMTNLKAALQSFEATRDIPVTTAVSTAILGASFPPSSGAFTAETSTVMASIAAFLAANRAPLMVNIYPYFSLISNPTDIPLPYALFDTNDVVVRDVVGGLEYRNLFDAVTDAIYAALERSGAGGETVEIVVSETGWPSARNGDVAVVGNAAKYNNNLIRHVCSDLGTPKRPGKSIETYVFAVYNENLKPSGTEQNFGLFYPNMSEVYPVDFTGKV